LSQNNYKKIDTFKSGHFLMSWKCSLGQLSQYQVEARILHETVNDLPILPKMAATLEDDMIRSIYGTAAIEGNPLSEAEVDRIYRHIGGPLKSGIRHETEIINLKSAYESLVVEKIDEGYIRQLHKTITAGIDYEGNNPGNYRNFIVKVGDKKHGGVYTPPKCLPDIEKLMAEYVAMINSDPVTDLGPLVNAALAHYYLGMIHPFADGNGRVARLVEAALLMSAGYRYAPVMLANYYHRNIDEYYNTFSVTRKAMGDVTPFIAFCLKGVVQCYGEIKNRIVGFIKEMALKNLYAHLRENKLISQSQHDLALLLLDHKESVTAKQVCTTPPFAILYRKKSERTARRDLQSLEKNGLILKVGPKYQLNLNASA
jgi:Fic family protein